MRFDNKIETSSAQIASILRQAIISGELKPGTRLREAELSESLKISRSPIREAFRILEPEGLVQITPNRGAVVVQLNASDLKEIYELRMLLELHAVRIACNQMSQEDLDELKGLFQEMEKKLELKDYVGYLRISHDFHECYIKKCKNERLYNLFRILRNNILGIQIFAYSYPNHSLDSLEEHKKILTALRRKDADKAEEYLRKHLESGYERAKRFLKK
jgi:DNA-binding GntR family transcriptional regulator